MEARCLKSPGKHYIVSVGVCGKVLTNHKNAEIITFLFRPRYVMFCLDEKLHAREGQRHLLSVVSVKLIGRKEHKRPCACVCNHPTLSPPASKLPGSDREDQTVTKC